MNWERDREAWHGEWLDGFKCALLLRSFKDYIAQGRFEPDRTEEFVTKIRQRFPAGAFAEIRNYVDEVSTSHEFDNNERATRILENIFNVLGYHS